MNSESNYLKKTEMFCSTCRKEIKEGETYHHNFKGLCEDCCMDMRTPRTRKTHWQYLRSIKTEYLVPGKNARK